MEIVIHRPLPRGLVEIGFATIQANARPHPLMRSCSFSIKPFGALDAKVRKDLRKWLREIHDRTGLTTVFVTHDQTEAMDVADCVAILNGGRIEQVGSPAELRSRPSTSFVQTFLN